jgi:predicted nuclease with TOPRIM domain
MSNIEDIVDSLENKISKVLHKLELLKLANSKLNEELEVSKQEILNQKSLIANWEENYEALKMANTILGSDDNKRETKLKINALIRDIDHCIAQLSD